MASTAFHITSYVVRTFAVNLPADSIWLLFLAGRFYRLPRYEASSGVRTRRRRSALPAASAAGGAIARNRT